MRLHVHLEGLNIDKVTMTHLARGHRPDRLVFGRHVLLEVQLTRKSFATIFTKEGSLASVLAHMCLQAGKLGESPGAHLTLMSVLASVGLDVRGQSSCRGELLRADLAVKLSLLRVLLAMRRQVGCGGKAQWTLFTLVWLLARVGTYVAHQGVVECEGAVADGARVRPLSCVYLHVSIQRGGRIETLVAHTACIGPLLGMRVLVNLEVSWILEGL